LGLGPLFNGAPGESTAYFTFSTDELTLTGMPSNGDVEMNLVSPGFFYVYYNPNPAGDWKDPATFVKGN